jgi:hypothetical protein
VFDVAEAAWSNNWAWGLPLIVLTVLVHALALVEIRDRIVLELPIVLRARRSSMVLAILMVVSVLLLTVLHAVEASAWAGAYVILGARADFASAMLYSLSAMTTYGHADVFLARHWQLMSAIEALNGMMLFGLSTAFLFAVLREHWPTRLLAAAYKLTRRCDFNQLIPFRCAAEANANENKGLRFAMRNETFRGEGSKSLKSLMALNQRFRGIVCFQ